MEGGEEGGEEGGREGRVSDGRDWQDHNETGKYKDWGKYTVNRKGIELGEYKGIGESIK